MENQFFIQMSGAPGSGKSTLAVRLGERLKGVVINHDLIKTFFLQNRSDFEMSGTLAYALDWVLAEDLLRQGFSIVMDTACNYPEIIEHGTELSKKYHCVYKYIECRIEDIELLDQRMKERPSVPGQRAGVAVPPQGAPEKTQEEYLAQFHTWIHNPVRPEEGAILIDTSRPLDICLEEAIEKLALS